MSAHSKLGGPPARKTEGDFEWRRSRHEFLHRGINFALKIRFLFFREPGNTALLFCVGIRRPSLVGKDRYRSVQLAT